MIKYNELRLGNIVDKKGQPTAITAGDFLAVDLATKELKGIEPIPITDQWLQKFGYKEWRKSQGYTYFSHEDLTAYFKLQHFVANGDKYRLSFVHDFAMAAYSPNSSGTFSFVHQLQNLHFAITGKEVADYKSLEDIAKDWA